MSLVVFLALAAPAIPCIATEEALPLIVTQQVTPPAAESPSAPVARESAAPVATPSVPPEGTPDKAKTAALPPLETPPAVALEPPAPVMTEASAPAEQPPAPVLAEAPAPVGKAPAPVPEAPAIALEAAPPPAPAPIPRTLTAQLEPSTSGAAQPAAPAPAAQPDLASRLEAARAESRDRPPLNPGADYGPVSPTPGISNYRPIGNVESRGVRLAPFTLRAGVVTGIGYDDNVTLAQANKTSSMLYTFSPSISVGLEGLTDRYYALYRGNYGRYSSSSADNYDDHNISLVASNEWTRRFRTLLTYDFIEGHNQRGSTLSNLGSQDRWTYNGVKARGSYGQEGAIGRVEGAVGYSTRRYKLQPTVVIDTRSYDQFDVMAGFSYRLAPKTRGLIELNWVDISHPNDATLDSVERRFLIGVTWEALAKTTGTLKLGYTTKDFGDSSRIDYSGPAYEAALTWNPRTYSTVNASARRYLAETPDVATYFSINTSSSIAWTHSWTERTRSVLGYAYTRQRLQGLGRTDVYHNFNLATSYALRRWLRVGGEVRHDIRESELLGFDYSRNLLIFTLEAAI